MKLSDIIVRKVKPKKNIYKMVGGRGLFSVKTKC
tara:strand:+ start:613 stop:714 length:102 start_codon:yes stop_codon:yes gene_type:complete